MSALTPVLFVRKRWLVTAGACALLLMSPLLAAAQETTDMGARIDRMERDIETLSRSVFKGEKPQGNMTIGDTGARAAQVQLEDRIRQLENDMRDLTNRTEEQGNTLRQIQAAIASLQAAAPSTTAAAMQAQTAAPAATTAPAPAAPVLDATPSSVPTPAAASTPPASPVSVAPTLAEQQAATPAPAPKTDPSQAPQSLGTMTNAVVAAGDSTTAYENALTLLKQKDYAGAEKAFNDFIKSNEGNSLIPNARYWLGETYFAQKKYDGAARVFAEGYQGSPKGPKAADNLLKLGLSLAAMNNTADACVALQQIAKDFPSGASSVRTRADQEIKRLKCGG